MSSKRQTESLFSKNIMTLLTGNAIAFIVPVILYPVMSRVFSPEDYAIYGLYISIFSLLEIGSAGRYDFAVVLPKRHADAIQIVAGGIVISILTSIVTFLFIYFFGSWITEKLNSPQLQNWLYVIPPCLFFVSISKLLNNWIIRFKRFKAVSINKASQKLAETFGQLSVGLYNSTLGLVSGDFFGRLFNAVFSIYQGMKAGFRVQRISFERVRILIKKYNEFPKYNVVPSMLNALGGMLPVFIISSMYSEKVTGSFNFSRLILAVPFALIATGISQVLMQQVSERKNRKESIVNELRPLFYTLLFLAIAGVIVLFFFAPWLFELIFGINWRLSGEYTSILIFSNAVSFIVSPFGILLTVLGKVKTLSLWQAFYFLLVNFLWMFNQVSIEVFLLALVVVDIVAYSLYGYLIYSAVSIYEGKLTKAS